MTVSNAVYNELRLNIEKANLEITKYEERFNILERQIQELQGVRTTLAMMDRDWRKRNLLIYGLSEDADENKYVLGTKTLKFFNEQLKSDIITGIHIEDVYRVGRKTRGCRPILLKLTNILVKERILRSTKLLRGTNYSVNEDFSKVTRETRRHLIPFLKEERKKGNFAILLQDKLRINGRNYTLEECKKYSQQKTRVQMQEVGDQMTDLHNTPRGIQAVASDKGIEVINSENKSVIGARKKVGKNDDDPKAVYNLRRWARKTDNSKEEEKKTTETNITTATNPGIGKENINDTFELIMNTLEKDARNLEEFKKSLQEMGFQN